MSGARRSLVLCYHAVSPTWEHRLSIQPDLLLRQVRALSRFRTVHATFDDAFRSAATVFPSLERLGVSIQIFVCTRYARAGAPLSIPELAGDDPVQLATMSWDELREHADRGVRIGSHAVSHPHLTRLSDAELQGELLDSKGEIEAELGRPRGGRRADRGRRGPPPPPGPRGPARHPRRGGVGGRGGGTPAGCWGRG